VQKDVPPRVTIIVLNWNGGEDTLACLESLGAVDYIPFDILVVDNGSTDGSVPAIRERFPKVRLLEIKNNIGYTGGSNTGMRWALKHGADYMLLLNNDTVVAPDFLRRLVEAAEDDPAIGIAGPTIYYYTQPRVIWSAGGSIDWHRGRTSMLGLDQQDSGQFGEAPREVSFCTGCALLVKATAVERIGLLDERFFAYYEETEWCVRAQRAGFKIVHVPRAHIWHKISPLAREASPRVHYYMTRNRLLFLKATRAGLSAWLHTLIADYLRTLTSWSLRPKWRGKRPQKRAMLRAISDAARGRWGPGSVV